ncbi:uncharacterized protein LOC125500416 [Athalia rosae]|uniref:uncharacterized protein LOC125500397 n=1 Tax=Athalia rosae TaxID=37344 RepID=UPI00203449CB|nr:uncharacterized protein LOC125500397 [Athalia rosae]XP_048509386.1 uncharacterized protein LOC125500416 [Athalia rosae]
MQQIGEESMANMDLAIIESRLKELDETRALLLAMKAAQQPNPTEHKGEAGVGEKAVEKVQAAGGGGSLKRKHRAGRDKDARRNKYKWSARKAAGKGGEKSGNDQKKNEKEEKEKWKKSRGHEKKSYHKNKNWPLKNVASAGDGPQPKLYLRCPEAASALKALFTNYF